MNDQAQDAVQAAIAAARANAGNVVAPAEQGQTTGTAVGQHTPGRQASLDDFSNVAAVEGWLKIKEAGIRIGDDPAYHETLTFRVNFSDIQTFWAASYGNPPVYLKSNDKVLTEDGRPWSEALRDATQKSGRPVRDFLSATLPLEVVEDIKGKNGTIPAGTVLGYTLAYTGSQEFARMRKAMIKDGLDVNDGVFLVKLGVLPSKNAGGAEYTKIQFLSYEPDNNA